MRILLVILFLTEMASASVKGLVLEKGTRTPMGNAIVYILPERSRQTTNLEGVFEVEIPDGEHSAVVNIPGYIKTSIEFSVPVQGPIEILVEKSSYNPYETTVQTKSNTVQTSQKNISAGEASKIAGTGGDTLRAVQTLPGVARTSAFSGNVIIRGSGPNDTGYLIEGHRVPIIFHFGGLASVVNTDLLSEIIYLPGGFGSPYGRASGGIIGTVLRDPRQERLQGYVFADVINAGFLIETSLGSGWSLGLTARRSYIGDVLAALAENNKSFDLTVAPYYYDGLLLISKKISDQKNLRFSLLGSYDELGFVIKEPRDQDPGIRGNLNNVTKFHRLIGTYTDKFSDQDVFRFSAAYGTDATYFDIGDLYFDLAVNALSVRSDWEHRFNSWNLSRIGVDNEYKFATVKYKVPQTNGGPISSGVLIQNQTEAQESQTAVFAEHKIGVLRDPEKWTLTPGLRFDRFKLTDQNHLSPRFASRYALTENFAFRGSTGFFYQPPDFQYIDKFFGNPNISSPWAVHYVLGFESDPHVPWLTSSVLEFDVFYKDLKDLIVSDASTKYSNKGTGKSVGAEVYFKFAKNQFSGWLSYTYSKATRQNPTNGETVFQYDQTHNATLILNYKTESRWEYGMRARYGTGNPRTPIVGARFDADNDTYISEAGTPYSDRLPSFFQMDLRVDKRWVYDTWILNAYLDLQNALNSKNIEGVSYNYNYSESYYLTGLPMIPSFGLRAEF